MSEHQAESTLLRRYLGLHRWIWDHLPPSATSTRPGHLYGRHLHRLVLLRPRRMSVATFFFRNRPEMELLCRLLQGRTPGASVRMAVLGCSKGAEVYTIAFAVRSRRPDLDVRLTGVEISPALLTFATKGVYAIAAPTSEGEDSEADQASETGEDQARSLFERMTPTELDALFVRDGNRLRVRPEFQTGIAWQIGDAGDPGLLHVIGQQDVVFANRFLCHLPPPQADACLRTLSNLVTPGGCLFVSGMDLDVRTRVALDRGWTPITELFAEVYEGDPSLREVWPWNYSGTEPIDRTRPDWRTRYASVFRINPHPDPEAPNRQRI
jgi:chemotaxis methyl-accepting protein methylase